MSRLYKALVIDDVRSVRLLVEQKLNDLGVTNVSTAGNGVEALDVLSREPDFDVILCDWHMERMDGLCFCVQLQKLPFIRERHIPIIFMTCDDRLVEAGKRQRTLETAKSIGIVEMLVKPFTTDDLQAALARCSRFEEMQGAS